MKYFYLICIFLFSSCGTDQDSNYEHVLAFKPESVEIDFLKSNEIKTSKGMIISFDQGFIARYSLEYNTNILGLQIYELYDKVDFALNGISTVTESGEILESAGMVKLELFNNGKKIELENYIGIQLAIPVTTDLMGYKIYNGIISADSELKWNNPTDIQNDQIQDSVLTIETRFEYAYDSNGKIVDSVIVNDTVLDNPRFDEGHNLYINYLKVDLANLNWLNIDKLLKLSDEKRVRFSVKLDVNREYEYTSLGLILSEYNSFMSMYKNRIDRTLYNLDSIPSNLEVTVAFFGITKDKYYVGNQDLRIGDFENVVLETREIEKTNLPENLD